MNRKALILIAALAVVLTGIAVWPSVVARNVPQWQGKSLEYWFNRNTGGFYKQADYTNLHAAFTAHGTNAVPFLLDKLLLKTWRPEPSWHIWLRGRTWIPANARAKYLPRRLDLVECQGRALDLFRTLGPGAKPAEPVLLRLLENSTVSLVPFPGRTPGQVTDQLTLKPDRALGIPPMTRPAGWHFVSTCVHAVAVTEPDSADSVSVLLNTVARIPTCASAVRESLTGLLMRRAVDSHTELLVAALDHADQNVREIARRALAAAVDRRARAFASNRSSTPALDYVRDHALPLERLTAEWMDDLFRTGGFNDRLMADALIVVAAESPAITARLADRLVAAGQPWRARVLRTLRDLVTHPGGAVLTEVQPAERNRSPVNLPAMVVQLALGDDSATFTAAKNLGSTGPAGGLAVPALIESLGHPSERVVARVVEALGQLGPAASNALPALRASATNGSWMVRVAATNALERIQRPAP